MPDPHQRPTKTSPESVPTWTLDRTLLDGFSFACRPGCGLCCFATPAVTPAERDRLIQILPALAWETNPDVVPARVDGGACQYLAETRCQVHGDLPFPCAEFPLSVHLGPRAQASLVLSCPGLSLGPLETWPETRPPTPEIGLEREMAAVLRELAGVGDSDRRRIEVGWVRAGRRADVPTDVSGLQRIRDGVRQKFPSPSLEEVEGSPLPEESEGLEALPLFYDPAYGRVALADAGSGVDLLVIREGGGVERRIASFRRPERVPRTSGSAARLLRGYLEYVLDRDATVGAVLQEEGPQGPDAFAEELGAQIGEIGGTVLARAYWRAQLAGGSGESLSDDEIAAGIRATDADYLDRATAGQWL